MDLLLTEFATGVTVVKPKGRFDAFSAPSMRERFDELLGNGNNKFIVDLSETTFLDSAGMAVLVSLLKRARYANGDTKLVWPIEPAAKRILHLTRFDQVFEMNDTMDVALKRF
ncbi:MAG: STAS domain-containing protein [Anaerolineae bacterium]|nr:STAS domain-containing protein [Anaerolineae bacterium]